MLQSWKDFNIITFLLHCCCPTAVWDCIISSCLHTNASKGWSQSVIIRVISLILPKHIPNCFIDFWSRVAVSLFEFKRVVLNKLLKPWNDVHTKYDRKNSTHYHANPFQGLLGLMGNSAFQQQKFGLFKFLDFFQILKLFLFDLFTFGLIS